MLQWEVNNNYEWNIYKQWYMICKSIIAYYLDVGLWEWFNSQNLGQLRSQKNSQKFKKIHKIS